MWLAKNKVDCSDENGTQFQLPLRPWDTPTQAQGDSYGMDMSKEHKIA
jgi:hypothetical protein